MTGIPTIAPVYVVETKRLSIARLKPTAPPPETPQTHHSALPIQDTHLPSAVLETLLGTPALDTARTLGHMRS